MSTECSLLEVVLEVLEPCVPEALAEVRMCEKCGEVVVHRAARYCRPCGQEVAQYKREVEALRLARRDARYCKWDGWLCS